MVYNSTRILTLPVAPEETYSYQFSNIVTEGYNREERRIGRRMHFRAKMTFGDIVFRCGEELAFIQFYKDSRGSLDSFQFRSSVDYDLTREPNIKSVTGQTFFTYTQSFVSYTGVDNKWEVYKKYAIGSGNILVPTDLAVTYKRIYQLNTISAGFVVTVNGLPAPGTIEWESATAQLLLGSIASPSTAVVQVAGSYNHRVRFGDESEDFKMTLQKLSQDKTYRLSNLSLVEVILNVPPSITPYINLGISNRSTPIALPPIIEAPLTLPLEPESSRTYSLPTLTASLDSGRESLFESANQVFIDESITPTSLYRDEALLIRNFFVSCKGRLSAFSYANDELARVMRFDQDLLTLTKKTYEDLIQGCQSIYDIGEVNLVPTFDVLPPIIIPPPYLPLPFTTCGYTRQTIRVDPQNPTDAAILSSNPGRGYLPGSDPTVGTFDVVVQALKTDSNMIPLPPGASAANAWRVYQAFWENGTLWIIILATITSGSFILWQRRAALYKLNNDGCGFTYVDSNLKEYGITSTNFSNNNTTQVHKTPTGTSVFVPANQGALFNTGVNAGTTPNGMLRFEIKTDGSQLIDFIPNSLIPQVDATVPTFQTAGKIANSNEVFLFTGSGDLNGNNYLLGTFNGLKYYVIDQQSTTSGIPLGAAFAPGTANKAVVESTYPRNLWVRTNSSTNREIFLNDAGGVPVQFAQVFGSTFTLQNLSATSTPNGSLFIRLNADECPVGQQTCAAGAKISYRYIFHRASINGTFSLVYKQPSFTTGADATTEAINDFPSGPNSKRIGDQYGNIVQDGGQTLAFLRAKTVNAVNFESIFTTDTISSSGANTPYGMVFITHASNMYGGVTTHPTINFISYEEVP